MEKNTENVKVVLTAIANTEMKRTVKMWTMLVVIGWTVILLCLRIVLPKPRKSISRVNYDHIRELEVELFGKAYEKGGEVHPEKVFRSNEAFARGLLGVDKPKDIRAYACTKCLSLNARYHEPWCPTQEKKAEPEVWVSNKHIIRIDRGDTYNIIEGEGLE